MKAVARITTLLLLATIVSAEDFDKTEVMIPMRDGVRLHTEIFRPKTATGRVPFLLERTPYGTARAKDQLDKSFDDLVKDGYIFVFQDIRGRYKSEGQFVMQRPLRDRRVPKSIDEASDAYDTIEWLLKNVHNNNGRAGILGVSYGGWLTVMALLEPHPALKAASEQASPADMFLGDDFHHNGAFRLSYGFEYSAMMETGKENQAFHFDAYDTFDWYLRLGPLSEVNKRYFDGMRPTWNNFVKHANYDEFWQQQAVQRLIRDVSVPNLNVAGWFDQEDFYGPVQIYEAAEKQDVKHLNYLVAGPWNHGGWGHGDGRKLGRIDFGSDTARYFREKLQAPWFAYWLKDQGSRDFAEVTAFQTGANEWKTYEAWPPKKNIATRNLYFRESGRLSFEPPDIDSPDAADSYVSDPAHPIPYRTRPIPPTYGGPGWSTWLTDDQRLVDGRPDVLVWKTEPLSDAITITGDVVAEFFASTTGSDSDWVVKLIDVYPDVYEKEPSMGGYELMIASEVLRARFRNSPEKAEPVKPREVTPYRLDLLTHNHRFLKGHRLMVQLQSTWFPLIDRNPQTFVPNIFEAVEADYRKATQCVYRSRRYPSHIVLPVEER